MGSFYVALSYACQLDCICCPITLDNRKYKMLRFSEIKEAIDSFRFDPKTDYIEVSGGEPTLHPDFFKIMDYITNTLSMHAIVLTNANRFAEASFAERFTESTNGRAAVTTALYSHLPITHDTIARRSNSFKQAIDGLKHLQSFGVQLRLKTIIQKLNYRDLPDIARFVNAMFPSDVEFTFHGIDLLGEAFRELTSTGVRFNQSAPFLEEALDVFDGVRETAVYSIPLCSIDPYYWKFFYTESKLPAMLYNSPDTNLTSNISAQSGTEIAACRSCVFEPRCPGVWYSYISAFGSEDLKPINMTVDSI